MIDFEGLERHLTGLTDEFVTAQPFPHIVIPGFLPHEHALALADAFPGADWNGWAHQGHEHQRNKHTCDCTSAMPASLRELVYDLNSGRFLRLLSELTGLEHLLPDPFLHGGGLHMTGVGGTLTPHADFHVTKELQMYRRLNLLVYLNDSWQEGDGGELELWEKGGKRIAKTVAPTLGTAVLFRTDAKSIHGFTNPVARLPRRSVALYYYTVEDAEEFSGSGETFWKSTAIAKTPSDYLRNGAEQSLLFASRAAASAAWRFAAMAAKFRR